MFLSFLAFINEIKSVTTLIRNRQYLSNKNIYNVLPSSGNAGAKKLIRLQATASSELQLISFHLPSFVYISTQFSPSPLFGSPVNKLQI